MLSTVSIQFTETTIAAACIYLAIIGLKIIPIETAMPALLNSCGSSEEVLTSLTGFLYVMYRLCKLYQITLPILRKAIPLTCLQQTLHTIHELSCTNVCFEQAKSLGSVGSNGSKTRANA